MNRLSGEKKAQILNCLVEGNSLRATARLTDTAVNTVMSLLVRAGKACARYQQVKLVNLPCKNIQCDEIWSFVYAKDKNVPERMKGKAGDIWTWTALCADTKLICSFALGNRDVCAAKLFMEDLASRLANRVQLTTDGLRAYLEAVETVFGTEIDYGRLVKVYGSSKDIPDRKYSASVCTGAEHYIVRGKPDPDKISTSLVERQNLTIRMSIRRFTRLTNGFSKKIENHYHAISLHFMHYNFCRIHKTLRITPAMAAGLSDHVWEIEEILNLLQSN